MAMFVFEDNKVVLKPENASPMILSNLLQCKPVGMVLLDQVKAGLENRIIRIYPVPRKLDKSGELWRNLFPGIT